ncbi:MAG: ABC transporter ATP-binding protein [Patescibacteria group bacterium]|jgi:ATP-binding cassette subfamily B protein/ATP-binding cassette subfamily C protein
MDKPKKIVNNLFSLLKIAWDEDKKFLLGYFITSFFSALLLFIVFFLYKLMIDQVFKSLVNKEITFVFLIVGSYLMSEYFSRFFTNVLNTQYFEYILRSKFQNVLTRLFMQKLAHLDFSNLENGEVRNLIAKVEDTYSWRLFENLRTINYMIYSSASLILAFFVALRFNPVYLIVLFILSTPLYFFRAKYGNIYWSIYTENSKKINYLWYMRYLFTNFNTLSEIKIYNLKKFFLEKTKLLQNEIVDQYKKPILKYIFFSTLASFFIPVIIFFFLKNFINQIIFSQRFSLGDFTFFLNAIFTFTGQTSSLLVNIGSIVENNLYVEDYFKLLSIKNNVKTNKISKRLKNLIPREIRFENVSFAYPGSKKFVLKNINLTIKTSQDIAIVGPNGAGKTTLIKLLFRFYDPSSGRILVDGNNLKNVDLDDWYRHLGVLFQDFAKYYLTVKENIEFGDIGNVKKKSVKEALASAQGNDLLDLPKKTDQILGRWFEDGEEISVGQWQKLAIARALYRNAPILVLDEPTSNIDAQAEFKIFNNLKKTYHKKTLIFISHRFSTVRMADKIYVIEDGQIVEQGKHEDLVIQKGIYAKYFNIQKQGYE